MDKGLILTPDEVSMVAHHAITRRYRKMCGERGDRAQLWRSDWNNEIEGALAEYWYCRVTNQVWTGAFAIHQPDAGRDEVRWTGRDDGNLLLYDRDSPSRRYILIGGFAPKFFIIGWVNGTEAIPNRCVLGQGLYKYPRGLLHSPESLDIIHSNGANEKRVNQ